MRCARSSHCSRVPGVQSSCKHHHHAGTSQRQTLQSVNYACKRQISPQLNHVVTGKVELLKYVVKLQCFHSKILDILTDDMCLHQAPCMCVKGDAKILKYQSESRYLPSSLLPASFLFLLGLVAVYAYNISCARVCRRST